MSQENHPIASNPRKRQRYMYLCAGCSRQPHRNKFYDSSTGQTIIEGKIAKLIRDKGTKPCWACGMRFADVWRMPLPSQASTD